MLPVYRLKANFSPKRESYRSNAMTVFRDFNIKNDILMELFKNRYLFDMLCANNSIQQYGSRFIQIYWANEF